MEKSEKQLISEEEEFISIINELKKENDLKDTNATDLIREEYDVNTPYDEILPLNKALTRREYDIAEILIKDGADTNAVDSNGAVPITLANENKEIVELLHKHGADINGTDSNGNTALFGADENTLKYLVENGANVNKQNDEGHTALMGYAEKGDIKAVKYLVKHGADINICGEGGNALAFAVKDIRRRGGLIFNTDFGETIKYLVDAGIDLNQQDRSGDTALHWACIFSETELVKYLIDKGADVNKQNCYGENALACVGGRTDPQIVKDLLEAGSDVNMQKYPVLMGMIPLSMCRRPEEDMLTWWERKEHIHILENMKMLIEAGANINIQDSEGKTPLIKAVEEKHVDFVEFLCAAGADLEIKDNSGKTAYDYATEIHDYAANKPEILEIIKKAKLESLQKRSAVAVALRRATPKRLTSFTNTLSSIVATLRAKQRQ